ncbi:MAG: AAA family ATPase, partial [Solirubrobacterales bacterium]
MGVSAGVLAGEGALLEREAALARLQAGLRAGSEGKGSLLLIEGPAGIGKTTLVEQALGLAQEAGMRTLAASGAELEREFPFGLVRQLFGPELRQATPAARKHFFSGAAGLSESILEQSGSLPWAGPSQDAEFAALHGLYWMLANLSDRGPMTLAVDDLQWADVASLRLLSFLTPRLAELPVTVIAALRSGGETLYPQVVDRIASNASETILVEPLSPVGAAA